MAATIVPKGPLAQPSQPPPFDRDAALKRLFSLPVPPHLESSRRGGTTYPIHTPLGRIMRLRGLRVRDVDRTDDGPNQRVLSDYLAGRTPIRAQHRIVLAQVLKVDPRIF